MSAGPTASCRVGAGRSWAPARAGAGRRRCSRPSSARTFRQVSTPPLEQLGRHRPARASGWCARPRWRRGLDDRAADDDDVRARLHGLRSGLGVDPARNRDPAVTGFTHRGRRVQRIGAHHLCSSMAVWPDDGRAQPPPAARATGVGPIGPPAPARRGARLPRTGDGPSEAAASTVTTLAPALPPSPPRRGPRP